MIGWREAWHQALYAAGGFYHRPEGPAGHFRTAAHAAPDELAAAVHRLATGLGCTSVVDIGAGRGELLTGLTRLIGPAGPAGPAGPTGPTTTAGAGLRLWGVDVVPRPEGLPSTVGWSTGLPALPAEVLEGALVVGWELLDVVPDRILEVDPDGILREVLVDVRTGHEQLGDVATAADREWTRRWWPAAIAPAAEPADRVEVGRERDRLWADLTARTAAAGGRALLAVDYAHRRDDRPENGSLSGFRAGRAVPPVPDGSMDLTTHVALDSVAAASLAVLPAGSPVPRLTDQRTALSELGVAHPELLDAGGLGGFGWLLQPI